MTTTLLVAAVVAALACPLHMLWAMRRGKRAACCPPGRASGLDGLGERQRALEALIAASAGEAREAPRRGVGV